MLWVLSIKSEIHLCASQGVCPNFGHPTLTLSFTKYKFLQGNNSSATIGNRLLVLELFQLFNGYLLFSQHAYSINKVRKSRMMTLGQGVEVRAHYPIQICCKFGSTSLLQMIHLTTLLLILRMMTRKMIRMKIQIHLKLPHLVNPTKAMESNKKIYLKYIGINDIRRHRLKKNLSKLTLI